MDPNAVTAQVEAARERAANDRLERVKRALTTAKEIQASKPAKE